MNYHRLRSVHRLAGLGAAVFLLGLSITGFLLARKGSLGWMRPMVRAGTGRVPLARVVSVERAVAVAAAQGHPELNDVADVDRVDYRPKDNVFKVVSRQGGREVQVDGSTAAVLSDAVRNDIFVERLHDLSYFGDLAHGIALPTVAVALGALSVSGIAISAVPILRRRKYERDKAAGRFIKKG